MCGFLVTPLSLESEISQNLFDKYISYRGTIPMNQRNWCEYNFKFSRLPIVDVDSYQNQPFMYENYILVFNGELYNYLEIRKYIKDRFDIKFDTNSDSEVFLKGFIYLGPKEFFKIAAGMWAYVISDKEGNIYWGRDQFGIKPLYFIKKSKEFVFSSSQNALLDLNSKDKLNISYLKNFIITGYQNPNTQSFYNGFELVDPGYCYSYSKEKDNFKKECFLFENNIYSKKNLKNILKESILSQYPSEVNSTLALSGGIDSSAILHTLQNHNLKINALSLDLYSSANEKKTIRQTVKEYDLNHEFVKVSITDLLYSLRDIIFNLSQPLRSAQPIFQYFLRARAAALNSKVFLTGDGSDEIFGGYSQGYYYVLKNYIETGHSSAFIKEKLREFSNLLGVREKEIKGNIQTLINTKSSNFNFDNEWISNFKFNSKSLPIQPRNIEEYCEFRLYDHPMPYWLLCEDVVSLLNGIETRVPFLDQRLVYKSKFLDKSKFYYKGLNKFLLREVLQDMPRHIISQKKKYPRPADTSILIFHKEIEPLIKNFINSSFFREYFPKYQSILKLYEYDKENNISKRSDNWFRLLTSYFFLNL